MFKNLHDELTAIETIMKWFWQLNAKLGQLVRQARCSGNHARVGWFVFSPTPMFAAFVLALGIRFPVLGLTYAAELSAGMLGFGAALGCATSLASSAGVLRQLCAATVIAAYVVLIVDGLAIANFGLVFSVITFAGLLIFVGTVYEAKLPAD